MKLRYTLRGAAELDEVLTYIEERSPLGGKRSLFIETKWRESTMPTQDLLEEMLEYLALQQADMQQLARFGELRSAGDLVEANKCGAALEAALG